jgi:putative ABC transport system ATP-binding protein
MRFCNFVRKLKLTANNMLKTHNLFFSYNTHTAFQFPDIDLKSGEHLLVLGESGIGKTTLLHLIAGLLRPDSGSIELMGTHLEKLSSVQLDRFRGKHIGLIFQRPHFVSSLSVGENLALVEHLAGKRHDKARIKEVLHNLGIENKKTARPRHLSQGEQQRAAIALAVINHPKLILADEPTSSLDNRNCSKVVSLLQDQAAATQAQLIIITHDQRLKEEFQNTLSL